MSEYDKYLRLEKFPLIFCAGCGDGIVLKAILRDLQRPRRRVHGHPPGQETGGTCRNILELVGDDIDVGREACQIFFVIGREDVVRDVASWCIRGRIEEAEPHPQGQAGEREHAAELAGAEYTNGRHG